MPLLRENLSESPPPPDWRSLPPKAKAEMLKRLQAKALSSGILHAHLRATLEQCFNARDLIPAEQAKLALLIEQAKDDIERGAREYQYDLVGWQLTRAAEVAEKRLAYFEQLTDTDAENKLCEQDIAHWFEYYAWGYDPRPDAPLSVMPFALFDNPPYDFQLRLIDWLNDITFTRRTSGATVKPREVGATDITRSWLLHCWRWRAGFSGLITSRNQDEVDKPGNMSTLFERIRFALRLLPTWMLPKGFDWRTHSTFLKLTNPENMASLIGSAPTPDIGRSGRYTVAVVDEGASLEESKGGFSQHTSLSQSTRTQIWISSVKGELNKFADLVHDGRTPVFEIDWREHPWKDQRWYDALPFGYLGAAMSPEEIAQEIDCNFKASQPGKVIKNCKEEYCFITWDELVEGFKPYLEQYRLENPFVTRDGRYKIPDTWNWGRISDYGESAQKEDDTHIWAYSLLARPQEHYPFSDSLFFFYSLPIMPIGATELEGFAFYSELEREIGVRGVKNFNRQPTVNDMSHEATDPKEVLLSKCGDNWHIPDLDFDKGRRKLIFHFGLTDTHLPNPFRQGLSGCPPMMGRSRIYFVAPPSEYSLAYNQRKGEYFVTPSQTQRGFRRLRAEISSWHYPPEERGKPVQKMRPKSVFDDIITTVRYALARWGVSAAPLTKEQSIQKQLPVALKDETIQKVESGEQRAKLLQAQAIKRHGIEQAMGKPRTRNALALYRHAMKGGKG